jgi:hypothetical protein
VKVRARARVRNQRSSHEKNMKLRVGKICVGKLEYKFQEIETNSCTRKRLFLTRMMAR